MKNGAGWFIHFNASEPTTLENQTGRAYSVLHDQYRQPSRLEVTDGSGKAVISFDTRAIQKFDDTVRQAHFRRIEPGAKLPLFSLRVSELDGTFKLAWGPYELGPLAAGKYVAAVIWEAKETRYYDDQSASQKTQSDAFVGSVRSAPTPFELPLR